MALTIKQQLVGVVKNGYPGINGRKYITIHETANTNRGTDAQVHANLQSNGFTASWHWQVDDKQAIQSFPHTAQLWHSGDGRGNGNLNSIGIEICVNSDGDFKKAVANAAELVKKIMKDEGIPQSNVVQHNRWSGKNCPTNLRNGSKGVNWADFNRMISGASGVYTPPKTQTKPESITKPSVKPPRRPTSKWTKISGSWSGQTLKRGQYGAPVTQLQKLLGVKADSYYGVDTENAVKKAQRNAGIKADGLAGKVTYNALKGARIKVDGYWGAATTKALQKYFSTPVDGVISKPSPMVRKLQELVGVKADGLLGPNTYKAMQRRFKTPVDGKVSKPSVMVKEMQRRLNSGKL